MRDRLADQLEQLSRASPRFMAVLRVARDCNPPEWWPETATAVAVQLRQDDELELSAPWGLRDLLSGVCRRNPERVSIAEYHRPLEAKQVEVRWPRVRVIVP